jgi:hypothetical protein
VIAHPLDMRKWLSLGRCRTKKESARSCIAIGSRIELRGSGVDHNASNMTILNCVISMQSLGSYLQHRNSSRNGHSREPYRTQVCSQRKHRRRRPIPCFNVCCSNTCLYYLFNRLIIALLRSPRKYIVCEDTQLVTFPNGRNSKPNAKHCRYLILMKSPLRTCPHIFNI